jgi:hypothetical protein
MCFSAGASFTAGAVISAIGIATILKVHKPEQMLFALIPLVFGIQQLAEGIVWLTLQNPGHPLLQKICMFIFLIPAVVLWPVMIPGSVMLMEENLKRRKILKWLLVVGAVVSLYYIFCLIFYKVTPQILNCHINYGGDFIPSLMLPAFFLYITVAVAPLFISGVKGMKWLGLIMFLACLVTVIFYVKNVTSVWCFFAAILSAGIYLVIRRDPRPS